MSTKHRSPWLIALLIAAACAQGDVIAPSLKYGPPDNPGSGNGKGGGEESTAGNNLSNPVIFAETYGITGLPITTANLLSTGLRTPSTATYGTLPDYLIDPDSPVETLAGVGSVYCQKTGHTWMPQWGVGATTAVADWGDNLTSTQFTANSVIRVETTLLAPGTMTGYQMYLFSGLGKTEQQCTAFGEIAAQPTVYSVTARLRIYQVTGDQAVPTQGQQPLVDLSTDDGLSGDGSGFYGAEVNVSGKIVYGYNLFVKRLPVPDKKGWYLFSFALEPTADVGGIVVPRGVTLTGVTDAKAVLVGSYETRIWVEVADSRDKGPKGEEPGT